MRKLRHMEFKGLFGRQRSGGWQCLDLNLNYLPSRACVLNYYALGVKCAKALGLLRDELGEEMGADQRALVDCGGEFACHLKEMGIYRRDLAED